MIPQRTILVVDDHHEAAEALANVIRMSIDATVHTATDGAEAIERTIDTRPQAIVMDIGMPGVGGIEAVHVLRRLFKGRPPRLIALTGLCTDEQRQAVLDAGFDAFLCKPVDVRSLLQLLTEPEGRLAA